MARHLHEKWASVQYVADREKTDLMTHRAVTLDYGVMKTAMFVDDVAGNVIMYPCQTPENRIIEVTLGRRADDWIGALYEPHAIFATPQALLEARKDLITMIEDMNDAEVGSLQGRCKARNRAVDLREMPTIQLIDIVADVVRKRAN